MRVLFTLTPARGSLPPLVPLARCLRRAGHDVAFSSSASFAPEVWAYGFEYFEAGLDWYAGRTAGDDVTVVEVGRRMFDDVIAVAERWEPDLIVREAIELSGCVAAESLGLPHASVASGADSALDLRRELTRLLADLRARAGLPPDPDGDMPYRYLHLCFTPPCFDGPEAVFPPTAHFLRHTSVSRPGEERPTWAADLPAPIVLVSLGTVVHRVPGLYEAIVEGLRDEPISLVVALGPDQDPDRLGRQPANVRVEAELPLTLLLPDCAVLVTHAGINTVKEAMSAGAPMVVVPIAGDQHYCAQRCVDLGLAEAVGRNERTPSCIRQAVRTVLRNVSYRERAAAIRNRMMALPDVSVGVLLLEQLGRERRPILAQPE